MSLGKEKGKAVAANAGGTGSSQPEPSWAGDAGLNQGSSSSGGLLNQIGSSAKSIARALDPRQADVVRLNSSFGASGQASGSNGGEGKASALASRQAFDHASAGLEALSQSGALGQAHGGSSGSTTNSGFRTTSVAATPAVPVGGMMDWDNFLSSGEADFVNNDSSPYRPVTSFDSFEQLGQPLQAPPSLQQQQQQHHQFAPNEAVDHTELLAFLRQDIERGPTPQQHQSQPFERSQPQQFNHLPSFTSQDRQHQQQMDGMDVLNFLNNASYSDYVAELESAGLEKHQLERREYSYSTAGGVGGRHRSALEMIQHLPTERQDIVAYLLQQGTYTDDVNARPFGWDQESEEISLAATRAERDAFSQNLARADQQGDGSRVDATTQEMEDILARIVTEATKEVATGKQDGEAMEKLWKVRRHLRSGLKL